MRELSPRSSTFNGSLWQPAKTVCALEQRFKGDRSGACIAAAVIENGTTARAYFCANAKSERSIDERTAFEIGSITKTMTAALLAEIIGRGEIAIDDPLAKLLPPGTNVPSFNGTNITVGNIVTQASGLPSFPWRTTDMSNPYARLTEADLLDTLAKTQLRCAPGSQREESNFALMVLSYALAKRSGRDFETLLRERLLSPLGMDDTFIVTRPSAVRVAEGHFPTAGPPGRGTSVSTWPALAACGQPCPTWCVTSKVSLACAIAQSRRSWRKRRNKSPVSAASDEHGLGNPVYRERAHVRHASGRNGGFSSFFAFDRAAKLAWFCSATRRLPMLAVFAGSPCTCSTRHCLPAHRAIWQLPRLS
jgi:CubicO group peptidase (beta-lactamase class C family)